MVERALKSLLGKKLEVKDESLLSYETDSQILLRKSLFF